MGIQWIVRQEEDNEDAEEDCYGTKDNEDDFPPRQRKSMLLIPFGDSICDKTSEYLGEATK